MRDLRPATPAIPMKHPTSIPNKCVCFAGHDTALKAWNAHGRAHLPARQSRVRRVEHGARDGVSANERIGKFCIRRELGRGGMGIVFLATDTDAQRDIALKLPRMEALVDARLRDRFLHEARLTVGLSHPGLVSVYEVGEVGAVCYIASEYVAGPTLAAWLETRRQPLPFRTAAALIAALARGVEYLHEHHLLHRDIKPSNVLLRPAPESGLPDADLAVAGVPCLMDFGLAKSLEAPERDHSRSTTTAGAIVGTAEYMAPEQINCDSAKLGRTTDVYALGAVLYELLTGHAPFWGRNKFDTLNRVLTQDLVRPCQLRDGVPAGLEAICLKCLERGRAAAMPLQGYCLKTCSDSWLVKSR